MVADIPDIKTIRKDFPILSQEVNGKQLVYLDNGATSQKPKAVLNFLEEYYSAFNSNIHRGVHYLSQKATDAYEEARSKIQKHINAAESAEVIFTSGTTGGINLIASTYGRANLKVGDEIIITEMEHHSNIVPWQMICQETGAQLKIVPIHDNGELDIDAYKALLSDKTKIVSIVHISNTLGTINPIKELIRMARAAGAIFVVDGAQSGQHMAIDVRDLDCDFFCFSGHKAFGPTGTGILYGKRALLDAMPPYKGGGEMIKTVTFEKTTYNELPFKFEAGTPNIAGGIGLGVAIDYINEVGLDWIHEHENELLKYGTEQLSAIEGLQIIGTAREKASVISFNLQGVHPYDVGVILDKMGIAVRTGHHCTEPLMNRLNIPGTVRASFAFYNNREDIDRLVEGVKKAKSMLM